MLPVQLKPAFVSFLSSVDEYTSYQVTLSKGRIGEVYTTSTLLSCLNQKSDPPQGLEFTAARFRTELESVAATLPGYTNVGFEIECEGFGQFYEGRVTQADYALHLSFRDTSIDQIAAAACSWDAYYFMQSKIARAPGDDADRDELRWGIDASFGATRGQPLAIECVRHLIGAVGLKYNLYCPRHVLEMDPTSHAYKDLERYLIDRPEEWEQTKAAGLWLAQDLPPTLGQLLAANDPTVYTWALFMLEHFFSEKSSKVFGKELTFGNSTAHEITSSLSRKKLFERDPTFIRGLQKYLEDRQAKEKLESLNTFTKHGYRPVVRIALQFPSYDYINTPQGPMP